MIMVVLSDLDKETDQTAGHRRSLEPGGPTIPFSGPVLKEHSGFLGTTFFFLCVRSQSPQFSTHFPNFLQRFIIVSGQRFQLFGER